MLQLIEALWSIAVKNLKEQTACAVCLIGSIGFAGWQYERNALFATKAEIADIRESMNLGTTYALATEIRDKYDELCATKNQARVWRELDRLQLQYRKLQGANYDIGEWHCQQQDPNP